MASYRGIKQWVTSPPVVTPIRRLCRAILPLDAESWGRVREGNAAPAC